MYTVCLAFQLVLLQNYFYIIGQFVMVCLCVFLQEYFDVIENPMDLSTVKENLLSDKYSNPNSLFRDLRLIFSNSRTFNTNKRSRVSSLSWCVIPFHECISKSTHAYDLLLKQN